jgi:hypothetical protein
MATKEQLAAKAKLRALEASRDKERVRKETADKAIKRLSDEIKRHKESTKKKA